MDQNEISRTNRQIKIVELFLVPSTTYNKQVIKKYLVTNREDISHPIPSQRNVIHFPPTIFLILTLFSAKNYKWTDTMRFGNQNSVTIICFSQACTFCEYLILLKKSQPVTLYKSDGFRRLHKPSSGRKGVYVK